MGIDINYKRHIIGLLIMVVVFSVAMLANANNLNIEQSTQEETNISQEGMSEKTIDNKTEIIKIDFAVPTDIDNSFKSYMDYRTITDTTSKQWEMQNRAYTDENGLRKIDNCYCVALGTYYADSIGDKFQIYLENGNTIDVIIADLKNDIHTNCTNQYIDMGSKINVIEFIVNVDRLDPYVRNIGDISHIEGDIFKGQIIKIIKLEER